MISYGKRDSGIFIYLNLSRGVLRYMYLMLALAKQVPLVLMVLLQRSFEEAMSVVQVVSSKG
jgi:hypothetical protein